MTIGAALVLGLLVACGSKSSKPSEADPTSSETERAKAQSPEPTDSCSSVGESAARYAREDRRDELGQIVEKRCTEDGWSDEVRSCMRKAGTPIHQIACVRQLPKDVQAKLDRELEHLGRPFEVGTEPAALSLTGIEPERGDASGGTYVLLRGARFTADGPRSAKVYFGSRQGSVVRFQSDTEMIVEAPGGKPNETVDILVLFEPGGQVVLRDAFTYVDTSPPQ